jgi:hypothetical protein
MVIACLIGVFAGTLFRPLILVPVIVGFCLVHFVWLVPLNGSTQFLGSRILIEIVALNVSYLVGALLRRAVTARP